MFLFVCTMLFALYRLLHVKFPEDQQFFEYSNQLICYHYDTIKIIEIVDVCLSSPYELVQTVNFTEVSVVQCSS